MIPLGRKVGAAVLATFVWLSCGSIAWSQVTPPVWWDPADVLFTFNGSIGSGDIDAVVPQRHAGLGGHEPGREWFAWVDAPPEGTTLSSWEGFVDGPNTFFGFIAFDQSSSPTSPGAPALRGLVQPDGGIYICVSAENDTDCDRVGSGPSVNYSFYVSIEPDPSNLPATITTSLEQGPLRKDGATGLETFDLDGDGIPDEGELIGVGLVHAQYFAYEIRIENTGAAGDLDDYAFLDVLPDGFRLSADAEEALTTCAGNDCDGVVEDVSQDCISTLTVTVSGPKAKKNTIDPRYVTIETDELVASAVCTTTVYVETTGGDSGKGKNAGTFDPKSCVVADTNGGGTLTNTISLNDGVKMYNVATNALALGPVGSIQLAPQGCP